MLIPVASSGQNFSTAPPAPFNPETDITWHSLYWAEGTNFALQGYSDTDSVTTWPNETAETDLTGTSVTYVASSTDLNGQPAVRSASTGNAKCGSDYSVYPDYTNGLSVVVIHSKETNDDNAANYALFDGIQAGYRFYVLQQNSTGYWGVYRGTSAVYGTNTTNDAGLTIGYAVSQTGNASVIRNGSTVAGPGASGSNIMRAMTLFNNQPLNAPFKCDIALAGIYEGNITADSEYANFKSWIGTHYGITVA